MGYQTTLLALTLLLLPVSGMSQTKYRYPLPASFTSIGYPDHAGTGSGCSNTDGPDWACGCRAYGGHGGTDYSIAYGTQVLAAASGVVIDVVDGHKDDCTSWYEDGCQYANGGAGNMVKMQHADGTYTVYMHLKKFAMLVVKDQYVSCGEPIAHVGSSGKSTGPHLHFETRSGGHTAGYGYDPHAGTCSPTSPSRWVSQGSYLGQPGSTCESAGPPPMPSNFRVTGTTTSTASLAWDDVAGETGYRIYKWDGAGFPLHAELGANVTTYTDTGLNCASAFFYKVSAYNASGESSQAGWIQADTQSCGGSCTLGLVEDTDSDGIPDDVEPSEGTDPCVKDNDVFNSARLFTMQQYRDFMAREGDAGGISYWTAQIDGGLVRSLVVKYFFDSPEYQGNVAPITRLYFAYFNRIPDKAGLDYWIGQYQAGVPLVSISGFFATSPEFVSTYGSLTNAEFVTLVYQNVLGRDPDGAGFAYWTGQLDSGAMTRGEVMVGFSESPEYKSLSYNRVFVTMMYYGMLRRVPEQAGFDYWVGQLAAGASALDIINGFLAAIEYHDRFLP